MAPGTVVITGPNGGMTTLTTRQYALNHPEDNLILLVRNPSSIPSGATPASDKVKYESFDMTDLSAVRRASADIVEKVNSGVIPRIKTLVCSAAIQVTAPDQPRVTKDGYEETVAVNHLAHFVLILELLPVMEKDGQVIIVGSDSHRPDYKFFPKKPLYKPLKQLIEIKAGGEPVGEARDNGYQRYGTSKLLQMMTGNELARRLRSHPKYSGIDVAMFDPGSMGSTGLLRDQPFLTRTILGSLLNFPTILNYLAPEMQVSLKGDSAKTLLRMMEDRSMASSEPIGDAKDQGGAPYFSPAGNPHLTYGETNEPEKAKELWRDTAEVLGMSKEVALGA